MFDVDGAIYGRNRQTSIRFFWIAVGVCAVAVMAFLTQTWRSASPQYVVSPDFYPVLLAVIVLVALGSAIANAYFEGGFAISVLNAIAVTLAFGFTVLLSSVTGVASHADAPQVLVFATFAAISAFGGLLAWGVGNTLRGLKSGSNRQ